MKKSQTILFQITSLFVVGSTLALLIVFSENIVLRLQTLQTLSEEIRKGEAILLRETIASASQKMQYYAYSSDPGQSSIWKLRGRRSPINAIKSENSKRVEIAIGPLFKKLRSSETLNTLAILDKTGLPIFMFDNPPNSDGVTDGKVTTEFEYETAIQDFSFPNGKLTKTLESGFTVHGNRLQQYIVFPIFSNATVLAHVYFAVDFTLLKKIFEAESGAKIWPVNNSDYDIEFRNLTGLLNKIPNSGEAQISSLGEKSFAVANYNLSLDEQPNQTLLIIRDISKIIDQGRDFQMKMFLSVAIFLLLAGYLIFSVLRKRLKPLSNAIESLERLSSGDLSGKLEKVRDDEVGKITEAMEVFRSKLRSLNELNAQTNKQRVYQQEAILHQTNALTDLLPANRKSQIAEAISEIEKEITKSRTQASLNNLTIEEDSVTQLFAASFAVLGAELSSQYELLDEKVRARTKELEKKSNEIQSALERNEELLLNILPSSIAERMNNENEAIADYFEECSILFADIVGFTKLSSELGPEKLVEFLNLVFSEFDDYTDELGLEKIKTIGDNYMVAGGVPASQKDHAFRIATMACKMMNYVKTLAPINGTEISLRIGIHSGPVVAGVIGKRKFVYDLWGDAVNTAARMESHSEPGKIHTSESTKILIADSFTLEPRGIQAIKGKGDMNTFWLIK